MRGRWAVSLIAGLGLGLASVHAEDYWRPVGAPAPVVPMSTRPAATLGRPVAATLGAPVPLSSDGATDSAVPVLTTSYSPMTPTVRGQIPDSGPPPVPPPGVPAVPGDEHPPLEITTTPPPSSGTFWGKTGEFFGFGCGCSSHKCLQSDHCFDYFISPVTNPSEFEDPRSLTEVRPIFIFQESRHHNPFFHDANFEFFNLQARVAVTDRLDIVLQKFGFMHIEPGNDSTFQDVTGFGEVDIGPKVTFLRSEQTGTVGAFGLTFEIPAGANKVFQDTGTLTLRPYLSMAQKFGNSSYGSFDAMGTIGYNFSIDNERTDNFFTSLHLDYNVANANKIYPLIEMNWRHYTTNGHTEPFDFEGGDLFNFGSRYVSGRDTLTLGPGVRYKFTEWAQVGTAVEFPIVRTRDLESFRWTLDFILRY